jgi:hypothetical protein
MTHQHGCGCQSTYPGCPPVAASAVASPPLMRPYCGCGRCRAALARGTSAPSACRTSSPRTRRRLGRCPTPTPSTNTASRSGSAAMPSALSAVTSCVDGIYAYQTLFVLQADKSSIVVKGPFFPQVNPWNKCVMQEPIY